MVIKRHNSVILLLIIYSKILFCIPTFRLEQFKTSLCTKCISDWKGEVLKLYWKELDARSPSFGHEIHCHYHPKSPYGLSPNNLQNSSTCKYCKKEQHQNLTNNLFLSLSKIKKPKKIKKNERYFKHLIDSAFAANIFYKDDQYFYMPRSFFLNLIANGPKYKSLHHALLKFMISSHWPINNNQKISPCDLCQVRIKYLPSQNKEKHVTWDGPPRGTFLNQSAISAQTN